MKPRPDDGDDQPTPQLGRVVVPAAMKPRPDDGDDAMRRAGVSDTFHAAMKPRPDDGDDDAWQTMRRGVAAMPQ